MSGIPKEILEFEDAFPDGCYTPSWEEQDHRPIRFWDAIKKVEELGRPLTEEELEEFFV